MKRIAFTAAAWAGCALLAAPAQAQDTGAARAASAQPQAESGALPIGASTRAWLELQRSGRAAGASHAVPGEIATLSWRRYVDSYKQPIPETLQSPLQEVGKGK